MGYIEVHFTNRKCVYFSMLSGGWLEITNTRNRYSSNEFTVWYSKLSIYMLDQSTE